VQSYAPVLRDRRVERRHIKVDQMQLGRVAGIEDKACEMPLVGSDFRNSASAWKQLDEFSPRRGHPAI
jgi:hypothetical protein